MSHGSPGRRGTLWKRCGCASFWAHSAVRVGAGVFTLYVQHAILRLDDSSTAVSAAMMDLYRPNGMRRKMDEAFVARGSALIRITSSEEEQRARLLLHSFSTPSEPHQNAPATSSVGAQSYTTTRLTKRLLHLD